MKAGQGKKKREEYGIFIDDPIATTLYRLTQPNRKIYYQNQKYESHLFLPYGGKGDVIYSSPPHKTPKKYPIIRFEIFHDRLGSDRESGVYIRLFFGEYFSKPLRILPEVDYPFRDCHYVEGDENCQKLKEIAMRPCLGCDAVKHRINLWQVPSKYDENPWLCKRINPFTGKISDSTERFCKFCHKEISSSDNRIFFCCPEHRYEYQKSCQKARRQANIPGSFLSLVKTWESSPKRCKHCGGILTGKQRNWCGDRCRKNEQRLRGK